MNITGNYLRIQTSSKTKKGKSAGEERDHAEQEEHLAGIGEEKMRLVAVNGAICSLNRAEDHTPIGPACPSAISTSF